VYNIKENSWKAKGRMILWFLQILYI
jgi:hypothetical protein